jgi:hypothetical protein
MWQLYTRSTSASDFFKAGVEFFKKISLANFCSQDFTERKLRRFLTVRFLSVILNYVIQTLKTKSGRNNHILSVKTDKTTKKWGL